MGKYCWRKKKKLIGENEKDKERESGRINPKKKTKKKRNSEKSNIDVKIDLNKTLFIYNAQRNIDKRNEKKLGRMKNRNSE